MADRLDREIAFCRREVELFMDEIAKFMKGMPQTPHSGHALVLNSINGALVRAKTRLLAFEEELSAQEPQSARQYEVPRIGTAATD